MDEEQESQAHPATTEEDNLQPPAVDAQVEEGHNEQITEGDSSLSKIQEESEESQRKQDINELQDQVQNDNDPQDELQEDNESIPPIEDNEKSLPLVPEDDKAPPVNPEENEPEHLPQENENKELALENEKSESQLDLALDPALQKEVEQPLKQLTEDEEPEQMIQENPNVPLTQSTIETSIVPPLQLLSNELECSGELSEIAEKILDDSGEKATEDLNDLPLTVNIEEQLKEFDGSDDEAMISKEDSEPIENLVDALCDSESSKLGNDTIGSVDVHSDTEDSSRTLNTGKDFFEEVDLTQLEREKASVSEENDVLADDRTQRTIGDGKGDHTDDDGDESRTESRMDVDQSEHGDEYHEEHIIGDQDHDRFKVVENEDGMVEKEDPTVFEEEHQDDSSRQDASGADVHMTSIEERITPNNEEDDEDVTDKAPSRENIEDKITSPQGDENGESMNIDPEESNCVDNNDSESPTEEMKSISEPSKTTDELMTNSKVICREQMDTANDCGENLTEETTVIGSEATSVVEDNTKSNDTQSDFNAKEIGGNSETPINEEAKSRIKTRISRRLSPETVLEISKEKNVSILNKPRKRTRTNDGSSDRTTPDGTPTRSKVSEEVEEVETNEQPENVELKELQIKELTDEFPDEKCNRCRKIRACQYKYMKNGEIRFLCTLKCVHGFRTTSKETYHLIARKIPISLVFDVQQICYACKTRKSCRYRSKRPDNDTEIIYLCDPKCYGSFVGMNIEKFFKRRKAYLVQEVTNEVAEIEKKCIKCGAKKKCLYSFRDDENATHFICDDNCFNAVEKEEDNRLKLKRRSVRVRDLGVPSENTSHVVHQSSQSLEPRNVTRTEEEAEQARFDREASLVRRCGECMMIIPSSRNILEWETLPFCNDSCLEKYQNIIGSNCTNCKSLVSSTSLGKYCVRFGFEIRQFCSSHCLDTYKKKNLKECAHCQKDISHDKDGFLAPVGDKSQFKDFCSKSCVKKYEDLLNPRKKQNTGNCAVCNLDKLVRVDLALDERSFEFCSNPCFSAFKFVNNISPDQCILCLKYFERKSTNAFTLYDENVAKMFCSRICLTVFISVNRKIVSCQWCKVKKYNFDMIIRNNAGLATTLCSITCLRKYLGPGSINAGSSALVVRLQKICDQCHSNCNPTFSLAMSDSTSRNFCTQQCVIDFQAAHKRPVESVKNAGPKRQAPYPIGLPKKLHPKSDKSIIRPVQLGQQSPPHSAATTPVSTPGQTPTTTVPLTPIAVPSPPPTPSLLTTVSDAPSPDFSLPIVKKRGRPKKNVDVPLYDTDTSVATAPSPPIFRPVKKRSFGTNTPETDGIKAQIITVPSPQPQMANKQTMCKPSAAALAMQACRPTCTIGLQTDDVLERKYFVPVPVPVYVPQPMHMYSMPFPVPVPIPIPIPVPIFIPTTRNTAAGIMKEIKKIQDKMPADPFEAELLMMAEMVADEKRNESDSEPDEAVEDNSVVEYAPEGDDIFQMDLNISTGYEEQPNVDIETSMPANAIQQVTPTLDTVNDYMSTQQQQMMMMDTQRRVMPSVNTPRKRAASPAAPRGRITATPPQKRHRAVQPRQQQLATPPAAEPVRATEPAERPDANMCLKYTFGVNAWRQWVMNKNADIEKSSIRRKTFKTELLQLTADELNYSLCLFVNEVRKPNGSEYAPDTIYYLVLGIQQYLYENGRIDNIFTDPYYERFTDCLDDVARKFSILYNDSQYIVTRVEEEHLWECKQLGAHSPHVLLSTLMFFNTKHFNLTTVDEHMQLSFSHIMKHWKRNPAGKQNQNTRNVLLRFYPPQTTPDNPRKKKVYEQQENENNPLRCPVKLYEFYLSKCPESVKTRSDVFYLQPERSCVPDSPVWYSTQPLSREALNKMLHRVKMVKEINVALLSSQ